MEQAKLKKLQDLQLNLKKDEEHLNYEEERYFGKWQDKKMPIWERQLELEATMKAAGTQRFKDIIIKAREKNAESTTKHGQVLLKGLINPMAAALRDYVESQKPAFQKRPEAAAKILARLDYEVTALVAGKYMLDCISQKQTLNKASVRIGEALEMECRLEAFEDQERRYFRRLHNALEEKRNYRHKRKVYNAKIKQFKIETEKVWDKPLKLRVGQICLNLLKQSTGLVHFPLKTMGRNNTIYYVQATEKTREWIENYNDFNEVLFPEYLPMLMRPRDWKFPEKGGYISPHVKLKLVKADSEGYLEELRNRVDEMPVLYEAINAIQKTAWTINKKVLDVVISNWENNNQMGDLPPRKLDKFAPRKPDDIETNEKSRKEYSIRNRIFCDWEAEQISKIIQVKRIIRIAKVFQEEKYLYFPHQLDFRGRIYAVPMFLHPQYADYARSLLHFAEGKAIKNNDDACWLAIHGANSFGEDKCSLDDRTQWISDNEEMIFKCAENPHMNTEWSQADKPYQFLAFCFEWREFSKGNGEYNFGYKSHIPVLVDGSCNGLQHFSAMLKDEIGGAAVNLTPKDTPADIYGDVADIVIQRLKEMLNDTSKFGKPPKDPTRKQFTVAELAQHWLQFGVDRKTCKRPVMTLPYGSRRFSHRKYIQASIMERKNKGAELPEDWKDKSLNPKYNALYVPSFFLANVTLGAIHQVVTSARDVMSWLQTTSRIVSDLVEKKYNDEGVLEDVIVEKEKEIIMPSFYRAMSEGIIKKWLVKVGDKVKKGDPLAEIKTDFGTMTIPSLYKGVIKDILIKENKPDIIVKSPIAIIEVKETVPLNLPINWTTPVGFYVQQAYPDTKTRRVKSKMGENIIKLKNGEIKKKNIYIKLSLLENKYNINHNGEKTLVIDKHSQALGISPNYVHSMDGAAMQKTIALASKHGLDTFQCIHDSFGTYASDTPKLIRCIKESFIEIYSANQLEKFRQEILSMMKYDEDKALVPLLPPLGNLNIENIWESDFFFA